MSNTTSCMNTEVLTFRGRYIIISYLHAAYCSTHPSIDHFPSQANPPHASPSSPDRPNKSNTKIESQTITAPPHPFNQFTPNPLSFLPLPSQPLKLYPPNHPPIQSSAQSPHHLTTHLLHFQNIIYLLFFPIIPCFCCCWRL